MMDLKERSVILMFVGFFLLIYTDPVTSLSVSDTIDNVVEEFWDLTNSGLSVDVYDLISFIQKYDEERATDSLFLTDTLFTDGIESWTNDFRNEGMTQLFAKAYFRSLNVMNLAAPYIHIISFEDLDEIIDLINYYINGNTGDGLLSESEFVTGFKELIFRNLPFNLLYVNYAPESAYPGFFETLPEVNFTNIFNRIDNNGDSIVTEEEFITFWILGLYGDANMAHSLFSILDYDGDLQMTTQDWSQLFDRLDCRTGFRHKNELDIEEFGQLDLIHHGDLSYPTFNCTLSRHDYTLKRNKGITDLKPNN